MIYDDRHQAGQRLADALGHLEGEKNLIVIALPRGGVPVGYQLAKRLGAPLDLVIPRKLGAPHNPEFAIGAVAEPNIRLLNERVIETYNISPEYLENEVEKQMGEIQRRKEKYRGQRPDVPLTDKKVILVDDGIATGFTILAAIWAIKYQKPEELILAVPVAPPDTADWLKDEVDQMVCLVYPEPFGAVGQFYYDFSQTSDEEVIQLLEERKYVEVG